MQTFISFLRGINMAGHNPVKMTELMEMYRSIGLTDVQTYIQSGNVIFRCEENLYKAGAEKIIEESILERFGYQVPVMIRTVLELRKMLSVNPFLEEDNFNAAKMAAILLSEEPAEYQIQKIKDVSYPPDMFSITGSEIYVYCPNGFGKTKLYTSFFEKKMGVIGTARNWKTITTLLNIAAKE